MFEVADDVPAKRLETAVNFLNQQLSGRSLAALRTLQFEDISEGLHGAATVDLARRAFEFVRHSVEDLGDERIVVQGLITLLDEPEFSDIQQARAAMRLFEDRAAMTDLLRAPLDHATERARQDATPYAVVIGHEHQSTVENPTALRLSLVGIAYGISGEVLGTVGVMGPTRMKYADAVSLVPVLADRLQSCLETL
jgi:heat-inducible transcriptional repressor